MINNGKTAVINAVMRVCVCVIYICVIYIGVGYIGVGGSLIVHEANAHEINEHKKQVNYDNDNGNNDNNDGGNGADDSAKDNITPFPFKVGGEYNLVNQYGQKRTQIDPDGNQQLLFFGYLNCENMCSHTLATIAATTNKLKEEDIDVSPIMITVDPENDTKKIMQNKLKEIHPKFVGLTGTEKQLSDVYKKFLFVPQKQFTQNNGNTVFSHKNNLFVLSPDGDVQAMIEPTASTQRLAKIVRKYKNEKTN